MFKSSQDQGELSLALLTAATLLSIFAYITCGPATAFGSELRTGHGAARGSAHAPAAARTDTVTGLRGTVISAPKPQLGWKERMAALDAIDIALTEVGDGMNYVWRRSEGLLAGVVKPIRSFSDDDGRICRELKITLSWGILSQSALGSACRNADGTWTLGS